MLLNKGVSKPLIATVFFVILITGTTLGVSRGLDAKTEANATIERGVDYNLSDDKEPTNSTLANMTVDPFPILPDKWQPNWAGPYKGNQVERFNVVDQFTDTAVLATMRYANVVSLTIFHHGQWMHPWWVEKVLSITGWAGVIAGLGWTGYEQWRAIKGAVNS